jgi:hypothetical protein
VALDGTFGDAQQLPTLMPGVPSTARDAIVTDASSIVVGSTGSGRASVATAWVELESVGWVPVGLPDAKYVNPGAIADHVVVLDSGTIIAIGRGDGPSFRRLVLWWSRDGGVTWTSFVPNIPAFEEPIVATNGSLISLLLRDESEGEDGLAGYISAAVVEGADDLALVGYFTFTPTPGEREWPRAMVWDGVQFVAGLRTNAEPLLATSTDGVNFIVAPIDSPSIPSTNDAELKSLAIIDGMLNVFLEQDDRLFVVRRIEGDFEPVDVPDMMAGNMQFLEMRVPIASDGHRVAYLSSRWDARKLLTWDGATWSVHPVDNIPGHRNDSRLGVFSLATAGGADLAMLTEETLESPGNFALNTAGLLWRRPDQRGYELLETQGLLYAPTAVGTWGNNFVVADFDYSTNSSTWFLVDPATATFTELSTTGGLVDSIAASTSGIYALVRGADAATVSTMTVWYSASGESWAQVETTAEPDALCSDGRSVAVEWLEQQDTQGTLGIQRLVGATASPVGSDFQWEPYEVAQEHLRTAVCGVNSEEVVSIHLGYDYVLATLIPQTHIVPWTPLPNSSDQLFMNATDPGTWEAWVRQVIWDGSGWIAVGEILDVEVAQDAFIMRSENGWIWGQPEIIAGGPGNQYAKTVAVRDGEIVVGGVDGQNATIWRIPL